ncbi:hypothetical protein [Porphyromonas sp. COT-239 OH1446]|uniref:hypothetical protein n=1 Tax=Porphyromonas sp. COT-239 OH1446 TaxID=1515613 RepID=UPI00052BA8AC|nr:hypothetical protein [Porphyromonas sp. COT-239 OH1446]KGN70115.1 hypothetical protein HQ37_03425 [Porphyromonas sp. COT-239 OH1446]
MYRPISSSVWRGLFVLSLVVLGACNPNYQRFEPVPSPPMEGGETGSTLLVEEYTGQLCSQCPQAARLLEELASQHRGRIIVVAMHAERSGLTTSALASEEANRLGEAFGLPRQLPLVMINRSPLLPDGSRFSQDTGQWRGLIGQMLLAKRQAQLQIAELSRTGDELQARLRLVEGVAKDLRLHLWLVEDVRAWQSNSPKGKEHLHRQVLRHSLTPREGISMEQEILYRRRIEASRITSWGAAKLIAFATDARGQVVSTTLRAWGEGGGSHEEEDPNRPQPPKLKIEPREQMSFVVDGKQWGSGAEVQCGSFVPADEEIGTKDELLSPYIFVVPGLKTQLGDYRVRLEKLDHLDLTQIGLGQVCLNGQCFIAEHTSYYEGDLSLKYLHLDTSLEEHQKQSVQLHYLVRKDEDKGRDHKIRLSLLDREGKSIAQLILNMRY